MDVMPTDPAILGFSNRWYGEAIKQAVEVQLPSKKKISIFSLPYFLATKLEAFHSRGNKDFRMSSDFEDIVTVLDGANDLVSTLRAAPKGVQDYHRAEFAAFLKNESFEEGVLCHLGHQSEVAERYNLLHDLLTSFIKRPA